MINNFQLFVMKQEERGKHILDHLALEFKACLFKEMDTFIESMMGKNIAKF